MRRIFDSLAANGMHDGVHIRLMVTRGIKRTPYQDPRVDIGAGHRRHHPRVQDAAAGTAERGLTLFTVHVRRGEPDVQDQKLNSHSPSSTASPPVSRPTPGRRRRGA